MRKPRTDSTDRGSPRKGSLPDRRAIRTGGYGMPGKKVLLLSVSAGHGHVRAAQALQAGVARWFPEHETKHIDLMTLTPSLFRKAVKDSYLTLVRSHPRLWGYMYARADRPAPDSTAEHLGQAIVSACNTRLLPLVREYAPDHVICTHCMPIHLLIRWRNKGKIRPRLWSCITDFVAHRFWLEPGLDGHFTAEEENVWRMRARGLCDARILATGIPIMPAFIPRNGGPDETGAADPSAVKRAARSRLGLAPGRRTILLMGGGAGVGNMDVLARELFSLPSDFQLVVLAGQNRKLLTELRRLAVAFPDRLLPMSFTDEVPTFLAAADLVVTKPGGLTTVECLAMGKPMLIYSPIPGQEERNADFLLEHGAALKAPDSFGLVWRVKRVLEDESLLERLAARAASLGKPYAARDILSVVFDEAPAAS